jgi:hypothetical protein
MIQGDEEFIASINQPRTHTHGQPHAAKKSGRIGKVNKAREAGEPRDWLGLQCERERFVQGWQTFVAQLIPRKSGIGHLATTSRPTPNEQAVIEEVEQQETITRIAHQLGSIGLTGDKQMIYPIGTPARLSATRNTSNLVTLNSTGPAIITAVSDPDDSLDDGDDEESDTPSIPEERKLRH